jgi:tRNA threonylcarbamoyladenosine biosynthesis protein TsaB
MLDARRMEVYAAVFDGKSKVTMTETHPIVLESTSFESLNKPSIAFGNGALKWKDTCENPHISFSEEHPFPHAKFMGTDATRDFAEKKFASLVLTEPAYLKEFMGTKPKIKSL